MSDTPQGEGWWLASDGQWYAPELHPDYTAPAPPEAEAPAQEAPPVIEEPAPAPDVTEVMEVTPPPVEPEPTVAIPLPDPTASFPVAPLPGEPPAMPPPLGPPPAATGDGPGRGRGKLIAVIGVVVALLAGGIAFAVTRSSDDKTATTASDTKRSDSDSTESSDASDTSASSDTDSSDSTDATVADLVAKAKKSLLKPSDLSSDFSRGTVPESSPLPCDSTPVDDKVAPEGRAAVALESADTGVYETIRVYDSVKTAKRAMSAFRHGFSCDEATVDANDVTLSNFSDTDVKSGDDSFSVYVDINGGAGSSSDTSGSTDSFSFNSINPPSTSSSANLSRAPRSSEGVSVIVEVVRVDQSILSFNFVVTNTSDRSALPSTRELVELGIRRYTS